jgi:hypothetical protein
VTPKQWQDAKQVYQQTHADLLAEFDQRIAEAKARGQPTESLEELRAIIAAQAPEVIH